MADRMPGELKSKTISYLYKFVKAKLPIKLQNFQRSKTLKNV